MKRLIAGSMALMLCVLGQSGFGLAEQVFLPRGELRIVDKSPKNWAFLTLSVFEHLVELDQKGALVPRLATGWRWLNDRTLEMTIRQGVRFHNGEVLDAEIVKLNWDRQTKLMQQHPVGTHFNFKPGSRLEVIDPYTVQFNFPEPDGGILAKLSATHIANRQFYQEVGWGTAFW